MTCSHIDCIVIGDWLRQELGLSLERLVKCSLVPVVWSDCNRALLSWVPGGSALLGSWGPGVQLAIWVSQDLNPRRKLTDSIWCPIAHCPWRVDSPTPSWAAYWSWSFSDSDCKPQVPFLGGRLCCTNLVRRREDLGHRMPLEKGCWVSVPETLRGNGAGTLCFLGHMRPGWA